MIDEKSEEIADLLASVARSLVDFPDKVKVVPTQTGVGVTFRIEADPSDVGKIIGKQGRTARALRTILAASSVRLNRAYFLDILDLSDSSAQGGSQVRH